MAETRAQTCRVAGVRRALREFRVALGQWSQWEATTVRRSVEFVRMCGLSLGCELEHSECLLALPPDERDEVLAGELSEVR